MQVKRRDMKHTVQSAAEEIRKPLAVIKHSAIADSQRG